MAKNCSLQTQETWNSQKDAWLGKIRKGKLKQITFYKKQHSLIPNGSEN